jgi:hypothetical protein
MRDITRAQLRHDIRRDAVRTIREAVRSLVAACDALMEYAEDLHDATGPDIPWRLHPLRERVENSISRAWDAAGIIE